MRLFISYSHKDARSFVEELARFLDDANHTPWYDRDMRAGDEWKSNLWWEIVRCESFVFVITPESIKSDHCTWERNWSRRLGKRIISIKLIETDLSGSRELARWQYEDFTVWNPVVNVKDTAVKDAETQDVETKDETSEEATIKEAETREATAKQKQDCIARFLGALQRRQNRLWQWRLLLLVLNLILLVFAVPILQASAVPAVTPIPIPTSIVTFTPIPPPAIVVGIADNSTCQLGSTPAELKNLLRDSFPETSSPGVLIKTPEDDPALQNIDSQDKARALPQYHLIVWADCQNGSQSVMQLELLKHLHTIPDKILEPNNISFEVTSDVRLQTPIIAVLYYLLDDYGKASSALQQLGTAVHQDTEKSQVAWMQGNSLLLGISPWVDDPNVYVDPINAYKDALAFDPTRLEAKNNLAVAYVGQALTLPDDTQSEPLREAVKHFSALLDTQSAAPSNIQIVASVNRAQIASQFMGRITNPCFEDLFPKPSIPRADWDNCVSQQSENLLGDGVTPMQDCEAAINLATNTAVLRPLAYTCSAGANFLQVELDFAYPGSDKDGQKAYTAFCQSLNAEPIFTDLTSAGDTEDGYYLYAATEARIRGCAVALKVTPTTERDDKADYAMFLESMGTRAGYLHSEGEWIRNACWAIYGTASKPDLPICPPP